VSVIDGNSPIRCERGLAEAITHHPTLPFSPQGVTFHYRMCRLYAAPGHYAKG
jgi:hypothetical protein